MIPVKRSSIRACEYYYQTEQHTKNRVDVPESPDQETGNSFFGKEIESMKVALFAHGTNNDIHAHVVITYGRHAGK